MDINDFYNHGTNKHNIKQYKHSVINTINSKVVADTISLTLKIKIGQWYGPIELIVLEQMKNTKFIIGADFLKEHNAVLNLKKGQESLSLEIPSPLVFCHAIKNIKLKPNSEGHLAVSVPKQFNNKEVMVKSLDHSRLNFTIANSINKVKNCQIFVRYVNASNTHMRIHAKTNLVEISVPHEITNTCSNINANSTNTDCQSVLKELSINPALNNEQKALLYRLLEKNHTAFSKSELDKGQTTLVEHEIRLTTNESIKQRQYRLNPLKREVAIQKVNEMREQGVLEDSKSPFASPIVLVRKKNGEWRFCADYRQLNAITIKDAYPLPRIDDSLEALRANSYFTKLDLLSGFWQIAMARNDREKTAIATPCGLQQFTVMPFGLTNAPATFQRLMDRVLVGLTWERCIVYLDDIIVFGKTFQEHNANLQAVLERIIASNLKLNPAKCEFALTEIAYLGHRITQNGIGVDLDKVEAINRIETPNNRQKLRRFLGMATYYKRFINNFSEIAYPLTKLTSIKVEFVWLDKEQEAFERLKSALKSAPLLAAPDFSKGFQVCTDASMVGIGAVLEQDGRPIAYASRACSTPEQNYSATEREALAVVWAVRYFKHYLYGREIEIKTDHKPLHDLKMNRHPDENLGRVLLKLQELNHKITYLPGKHNLVSDVLSRDTVPVPGQTDLPNIEMRENEVVTKRVRFNPNTITFEDPDWISIQNQDEELKRVSEHLKQKRKNISHSEYRPKYHKLSLSGDMIVHGDRIVIPINSRQELIKKYHEAHCHEKTGKLSQRLIRSYFWPRMEHDITEFCSKCDKCQKTKERLNNCPDLGEIADQSYKPLEFWSIDFQGPYKTSKRGNRYIVVAIDYGSKWVESIATQDCSAVTTARFIVDNIILRHGAPKRLHTDQGTNFESKLIYQLCRLYNIKKSRSSPYHPQGNGLVERENRSIKNLLRSAISDDQSDWDDALPHCVHARNTEVHSSTGYSPYEMLYAKEPSVVIVNSDIETNSEYVARLAAARKHIEFAARTKLRSEQIRRHKQYERTHKTRVEPLKVGDQVLITNEGTHPGLSKRLEPKYKGPMTLVSLNKQTGTVENPDNNRRKDVHLSKIHKYLPSSEGKDQQLTPSTAKNPSANINNNKPVYVTKSGRNSKPVNRFSPQ